MDGHSLVDAVCFENYFISRFQGILNPHFKLPLPRKHHPALEHFARCDFTNSPAAGGENQAWKDGGAKNPHNTQGSHYTLQKRSQQCRDLGVEELNLGLG
ncbi:hypothetical protein DV515_00012132 [Chloebia gouldiae]|uniref:Uncharacterized protein n=1 Tax=Chloebia gouldiae TaxID=44316 RepID=A0A3L8S4C9_CHLGU|nr:hypothetical protein DV515_00012132 [Chloebia gouldiae]